MSQTEELAKTAKEAQETRQGSSQRPAAIPAKDQQSVSPRCDCELLVKFIEIEYEYLTQSSFHTDALRNQFIQFYLILVGAAATAIVGLAELQFGGQAQNSPSPPSSMWAFSAIAVFIGLIGIIMIPIFARLRRVVLESLQGTVLLKKYVITQSQLFANGPLSSAFLWDAKTVPTDERYFTASFILIFVFMLLDSAMFGLAALLLLLERVAPCLAGLWSAALSVGLLTLQVMLYRLLLWHEIRKAQERCDLAGKLSTLGVIDPPKKPALWRPLIGALVVGGLLAALLVSMALGWCR